MTAKKPQDHKKPSDASEEFVVTFDCEGMKLTAYGDNITGEIMELLAAGDIARFIRELVGPEQWETVKKLPVRKYQKILEVWTEASKEAGNS